MLSFFKVFLRGFVVTLLLPFIAVVWGAYGLYCVVLFIIMFFKGVIDFFKGKTFGAELIEDLEARKILLEKEKADEQAKQMLNLMYQNVMANNAFDHPTSPPVNDQPHIINPPKEYGPDVFNDPSPVEEKPENEEPETGENDDLRTY